MTVARCDESSRCATSDTPRPPVADRTTSRALYRGALRSRSRPRQGVCKESRTKFSVSDGRTCGRPLWFRSAQKNRESG
jgi:hypothetical protein